ncbi:hypothetical protein CLH62_20380 [Marinobacter guineae]|uniref:Uncharacterized protein n=1 Tax=Marinobacter guineae TaxID=432303 RepID=A0A2G1VAS4_9GAMM|nr:hypothetical protein [Marinobacter guineae]PHQ23639.1 hypothetical protein CLH62_20380 [Marinobacter guineae]
MDTRTLSNNTTIAGTAVFFDPNHYLITSLRRAVANKQNILLSSETHGDLILLASRGEYFFEGPDLPELLQLPAAKCRLRVLSEEESNDYKKAIGRNIDELMWRTVYYTSEGRLMEGYHWNDVVQLDYWPNLTRLPLSPNTFRILALFYKHPTSVYFAARLLKVPMGEMCQIYSAARAAGFARAINRKAEEPRLDPHRNQTLLTSLLSKLAGR